MKYFTAIRNILQEYEIFYKSMKYFTARQQYNRNQMLHFLSVIGNFCIVDSYIYLNNNTKKWYCCVSMATMVWRKR